MLKSRVHRTWVDVVSPGQLPDSSQPLKGWVVNDLSFPNVQLNEPMDWASKLVKSVGVC